MKTHAISTSIRRGILAGGILTLASASHAAIVISLQQVGANVVETGSGSANLSALTLAASSNFASGLQPNGAISQLIVGPSSAVSVSGYLGLTGPTSFGPGGSFTFASSGTGSTFGIYSGSLALTVPNGYVSGTALSGTAIFNAATFASLGVTTGTYTWTWGSGATADSLTVQIGAALPEPGSALAGMLALGVCLSGVVKRSRRQTVEAQRLASALP